MSEELNNCRCGGKPEVERRVREGRDMTAKASPRPWFVNGHSIEANDPDGLWLQNERTGRGVVANLPSCPKSRMSVKNRKTWDAIVEANAALIVDAVNERDRLRAALNEVCRRVSVALNCPRNGEEAFDLLVHDLLGIKECARAAIGEEKE